MYRTLLMRWHSVVGVCLLSMGLGAAQPNFLRRVSYHFSTKKTQKRPEPHGLIEVLEACSWSKNSRFPTSVCGLIYGYCEITPPVMLPYFILNKTHGTEFYKKPNTHSYNVPVYLVTVKNNTLQVKTLEWREPSESGLQQITELVRRAYASSTLTDVDQQKASYQLHSTKKFATPGNDFFYWISSLRY